MTDNNNLFNKTNFPFGKLQDETLLPAHTFDQDFYIQGIAGSKLTLLWKDLHLIPDIKDKSYYTLDGLTGVHFSDKSDAILRIYAKRILNEMFQVHTDACPCTKAAALSTFVRHWMIYLEHERNHTMNPVEIFCGRKGVCIDYTHLLSGLLSSIDLHSFAVISGQGIHTLGTTGEAHAWLVFACPGCHQYFEFDPTWGFTYQCGPDHVPFAVRNKINDYQDKIEGGDPLVKNITVRHHAADHSSTTS